MSQIDIRDIPIVHEEDDYLNIEKYADALTRFIVTSDTPITISLQGEWGSGKSSLMNIIKKKLCDEDSKDKFEAIWINTWELYLQGEEKDIIEHLSYLILKEINRIAKSKNIILEKEFDDIFSSFKRYFFKTSDIIMSMTGADEEARKQALGMFNQGEHTYVSQIRNKIAKVIDILVHADNSLSKKGFVFFIDDLDRIQPSFAIKVLEVLKNLFVIENCVFVLAVDYEVILKGLKAKYGEDLDESDKTYRSYFDKLIQLPFVMPISKYNINTYVMQVLYDIGYFEENHAPSNRYQAYVIKTILLTVGKNPRVIKRLMNAVKLSKIFDDSNERLLCNDGMKLANLIFVCMQMAYPKMYDVFEQNIHYKTWTKEQQDMVYDETFNKYRLAQQQQFLELIFEVFEYDENINKKALEKIIALSVLTNMSYNVEDDPLMYNGQEYNLSSETQSKQGSTLIDMIELSKGIKVLDVGCGNGKTTLELYSKNPSVYIDAFDLSLSQIKVAIKNQDELGVPETQVHFYQKNAITIDYEKKYDLIFSNATLHWVTEAKEMYGKLFKALKPEGKLAVHQGGFRSYFGLHKVVLQAIHNLNFDRYFENWEYPIYYPTSDEMEHMLLEIGYEQVRVISHVTDGKEHSNLIDNFKNASLLPYLNRLPDVASRENLTTEYYDLCTSQEIDTYTHRLYIFAKRGA